jgi:FG-GAP-like repeat
MHAAARRGHSIILALRLHWMGSRTLLGALTVLIAVAVAHRAVGRTAPQEPVASPGASPDEAMARKVCTACHAFPTPDVLPRDRWDRVVVEMTALTLSGTGAPRGGPPLPLDFDPAAITRFYRKGAPEVLPAPSAWPPVGTDAGRFRRHAFRPADGTGLPAKDTTPIVANVRFFDLDGDGRLQIVAADMKAGLVLAADPKHPEAGLRVLGRVPHPCHTEVVDLDRDGLLDLVVADLGDVPPGDYLRGSVVWLQRLKAGGYAAHTLASGLPRVADVQAADVDGDGDPDLIVAAFGWRRVGGIYLLENRSRPGGDPVFVTHEIDPRQGAIHVPIADLDGDGKLDFVALLAQHHESVVAFLGDGAGGFRPQTLYAAPHPAWGSSGLALVDFDRDGDLDVLVTNGDMLDDFLLKPYHGMRWLENRGKLSFQEHELATLPGIHRALAADIDGDGDLDVVACALVQFKAAQGQVPDPRAAAEGQFPSLVWLEQVSPGRFTRHTLELGGRHVSLDIADYDRDGDPDIVVGHFHSEGGPWVEVWENVTKTP